MVKISGDVIKPFNGEGDVVAWLQKVELVASLSEVKSLAKFIPLYLEDGAMAVYLEMEDEDKKSAEKIKERLKDAFTDGMFVAFGRLKRLKWIGEAVDVYANEIRRLAREAGFEGSALEHVVRLTFITGFPDDIGVELQQVEEIKTMAVGKICARARILTSNRSASTGKVAAPALKKPERKRLECYKCGGPHLMRECEKVRCFICNEAGHISTSCPQKRKQQKSGWCATNWIDTTRAGSVDRKMPIIQATVGGVRTNALVDTGCTTSVVQCDLAGRVLRGEEVLAFDGRRVQTGGRSMVGIRIGSKSVELEVTVMEDMVDGIGLIIGMDLIERLGGVSVRERQVRFGGGNNVVAAGLRDEPKRAEKYCFVEDRDFDGEVWTVKHRMKEGQRPVLKNKLHEYEKRMTPREPIEV